MTNAFGATEQMVTRFDYDELGNLLRQMDALSRTNSFEYDALGRRVKETMPQGQVQRFAYDAVGNLKLMTNFNSVVLTNSYDLLNRLTNKASASGYAVRFAYSATSQRTNMVDASGTTAYLYNNRDRLMSKASAQGTLNYDYDIFGNLKTIASTTSNGVSLGYGYDSLNRVTNVTQASAFAAGYNFDAVGNLQTVRLANAVTNTYIYNALNRLTNITAKTASGTIASFNYRLAAAGNRTNLIESINSVARTNVWNYDALYQLTNETVTGSSPTGTISYRYDGVGNRTNRTSSVSGITNQAFAYTGNDWLTSDAYDNNGNTRTNGANNYAYDAENRLTNSTTTGTNITMLYNGDGLRVAKTIGTNTTLYLLDDRNPTGYAQVLEEKTVSGGVTNLAKVFTYGLDLISQRQVMSSTTHYYGHDGNGNVRYLTATNGTVSDTYTYEAFGTVIAQTGTTPNDYRYSGEQYDPNLGFTYLRARYLNPNTGRFTSRDTFAGYQGEPMSLHRYLYAHGNPINNTDPSGHEIGVMIAVLSISGTLASIGSPATTRAGAAIGSGSVSGKSRSLTSGEITMAQIIFGGKINYTKVKVFNRPYVAQSSDTAVTPNGNIYVRGDGTSAGGLYRTDYSLDSDVYVRAIFIHEMTHVWQHQEGMSVTVRAILDRNYHYDLDPGNFSKKDFKKYGIEEQAQIVEDFYLLLSGSQIIRDGSPVATFPAMQTYQLVTGKYFP